LEEIAGLGVGGERVSGKSREMSSRSASIHENRPDGKREKKTETAAIEGEDEMEGEEKA